MHKPADTFLRGAGLKAERMVEEDPHYSEIPNKNIETVLANSWEVGTSNGMRWCITEWILHALWDIFNGIRTPNET